MEHVQLVINCISAILFTRNMYSIILTPVSEQLNAFLSYCIELHQSIMIIIITLFRNQIYIAQRRRQREYFASLKPISFPRNYRYEIARNHIINS